VPSDTTRGNGCKAASVEEVSDNPCRSRTFELEQGGVHKTVHVVDIAMGCDFWPAKRRLKQMLCCVPWSRCSPRLSALVFMPQKTRWIFYLENWGDVHGRRVL